MSCAVVDASLAAKWFLPEEHHAEARALLATWRNQGTDLIAPSWFACEVANVFFRRIPKGALTLSDAKLAIIGVLDEMTIRDFDRGVTLRAVDFAHRFGQPASYDAHYLALAEHLGCQLWTADEKFWNATKGTFTWVRWVGEVMV